MLSMMSLLIAASTLTTVKDRPVAMCMRSFVYFDRRSDRLDKDARSMLNSLMEQVRGGVLPSSHFVLETTRAPDDMIGNKNARRRAEAVKRYLVRRGFNSRLSISTGTPTSFMFNVPQGTTPETIALDRLVVVMEYASPGEWRASHRNWVC